MAAAARRKGVTGILICDHGPGLGMPTQATFWWRLSGFHTLASRTPSTIEGVRVFKGIEANALDREGAIDAPFDVARHLDLVLLGLHPYTTYPGGDAKENAAALCRAIERNPYVDILVHPYNPAFPTDLARVLSLAAEQGIAVEINESVMSGGRRSEEDVAERVRLCAREGVAVSLGSDAHWADEVGEDESIRRVLDMAAGESLRVVNRTLTDAEAFVAERRERRETFARGSDQA